MPFRYYPLPVPAAEAHATFAPIATAASEQGYRFYTWPDNISVVPDSTARITYMFDVSGNYVMCVTITDKKAAGETEASLAAGKMKGDVIWARAMELRRATAPAPVIVEQPPQQQPGVQIQITH